MGNCALSFALIHSSCHCILPDSMTLSDHVLKHLTLSQIFIFPRQWSSQAFVTATHVGYSLYCIRQWFSMIFWITYKNRKSYTGVREKVPWLKALTALTQDMNLLPNMHMMPYNSSPRGFHTSELCRLLHAYASHTYMHQGTQTSMQNWINICLKCYTWSNVLSL